MRCCLDCNLEFYQGDVCPECKGKNIIFERAEKEMYFKSVGRRLTCKMCGFHISSDEKITSCPNCNWNVKVADKLINKK